MASKATLLRFLAYAHAAGYKVGEHPAYGVVHKVHMDGSWHYKDGAADINFGVNGPVERQKLLALIPIAQSLGLAVTFARDGVVGSAAQHKNHLHVDIGEWSNLGRGPVRVSGGNPNAALPGTPNIRPLQAAVRAEQDNVNGPDTRQRVAAVRAASAYGGRGFPYGAAYTQRVVGAVPDDAWGKNSNAAHDATVRAIQRAVGVAADGVWGAKTEAAVNAALDSVRIV